MTAPLPRAIPVAAEPDGEAAEKLRQALEAGRLPAAAAIAEAQLSKRQSARMYWWLGRVRWKQGQKPAARRAWARARAVLAQAGAKIRVVPMPPDSFRALAWHGRKRLVILRWRKHPEKILGVKPWVELWHSAGSEPWNLWQVDRPAHHVAATPDGRTVFWSSGPVIHLADGATGAHVARLTGHKALVVHLATNAKGTKLASCSNDHTVRVWALKKHLWSRRVTRGRPVRTFQIRGTTPSVMRIYTGRGTYHHNRPMNVRARPLRSVFSPAGDELAVAADEGSVHVLNLGRTWRKARVFRLQKPSIWFRRWYAVPLALAYTANGRALWTVHGSGNMALWRKPFRKASRIRDGKCSPAEYIKAWGKNSLRPHGQKHQLRECGRVSIAAISVAAGRMAAAGVNMGYLRRKVLSTGKRLSNNKTHHHQSLAYSADGKTLAAAYISGGVQLWRNGKLVREVARRKVEEWIKAMSRDGRFLAIMDRKRGFTIWDTVRSTPVATIGAKMRATSSAAFSPDGRTVALGLDKGKVGIWETRTGTRIKTLATGWKHALALAFSNDGKVLAASGDKEVLTWNWPTGRVRRRITGHTHTVYDLSLSSNGRVLASGSRDTTARVWDTKTGRELARFTGHRGITVRIAVTPDGRTLATVGGYQRFVRVFDIRSKKLISTVNLRYPTKALAFAPDNRTLALGLSFSGTRLWNARTGRSVRTLKRRFLNAQKIMFLKGGKILVRFSLGGKVTAVRTEDDRVLVHVLPVTGGGYAAYNPLGAVDGPEPFRNIFLTMVSSPKGRTAFGWQVGWDRFHVPGLITRALKGRQIKPR